MNCKCILGSLLVIVLTSLEFLNARNRKLGRILKWADCTSFWLWYIVGLELTDIVCHLLNVSDILHFLILYPLLMVPVLLLRNIVRKQ